MNALGNAFDVGNFLLARFRAHGRLFYPTKASEMHVPYNVGRNKAKREKRATHAKRGRA